MTIELSERFAFADVDWMTYLFLARVQFVLKERATLPREAKAACREYIQSRCAFRFATSKDGTVARAVEAQLKTDLKPVFNLN